MNLQAEVWLLKYHTYKNHAIQPVKLDQVLIKKTYQYEKQRTVITITKVWVTPL